MGFWSELLDKIVCRHKNKRGVYGDEINHAGGRRLMCVECGKYLDGLVYDATVPAKPDPELGVWGHDWFYYYHSINESADEFPKLPEGFAFEVAKTGNWEAGFKKYCVRIVDKEGNVHVQHGYEDDLNRTRIIRCAGTAVFVMMKTQEKDRKKLKRQIEESKSDKKIEVGVYWQDEE